MIQSAELPETPSLEGLLDWLSVPSQALVEAMASLDGDLIVLGAGGKLGPNIIRLMQRADQIAGVRRKIIAASRFSDDLKRHEIAACGAEIVPIDLAEENALAKLPEVRNVLLLVGSRFGMAGRESGMWFTNTYLPGEVVSRFLKSRIVMLSTGNVYPFVPWDGPWPTESTPLNPVGEYAMSCLGRERVSSHLAEVLDVPLSLIRLNYSVEMRYGPIVDLIKFVKAGQPVDLTMGYLNLVWQGYSNEVILRSFLHASNPPFVLNVTGSELVSVRQTAEYIGKILGVSPIFSGTEAATALLSDAGNCHRIFGSPLIGINTLIERTIEWINVGLPLFSRTTGFQSRKGSF